MNCKYMRIQGREDSWVTKYPKGVFGMCWRLIMDGKMDEEDEKQFRDIDKWFRENLPEPEACKNGEKVITFFKTAGTEEMQKMITPAIKLLDKYNHPYDIVFTNFVGTIIYEDKWQVAVRVEDGHMI
ncbi:MAG: hypothetical protein IKW90_09710 [Lachnospiraceae bacterium]|nr:hypothetical protein [Lachnospiraceae bacterium]